MFKRTGDEKFQLPFILAYSISTYTGIFTGSMPSMSLILKFVGFSSDFLLALWSAL